MDLYVKFSWLYHWIIDRMGFGAVLCVFLLRFTTPNGYELLLIPQKPSKINKYRQTISQLLVYSTASTVDLS